ncbi:MAG: hypothetical protein JWQ96_25 [Segetibacter sp.]|nr:hypothetical protein [Segetibacter sp.]
MATSENTKEHMGQDEESLKKNVGPSLGIDVSSDDSKNGPDLHSNSGSGTIKEEDTGGAPDNGSKTGSGMAPDGSADNPGGKGYGSADGDNNNS